MSKTGVLTRSVWSFLVVLLMVLGCSDREDAVQPRDGAQQQSALVVQDTTETVWVLMKEQADLRPARTIKDWDQRGQEVHRLLTGVARSSQARLLGNLTSANATVKSFWIVNSMRVTADKATIAALADDPAVAGIYPDGVYELPPVKVGATEPAINGIEWGVASVRAPEAWTAFGARGEGVVVANIDTGVEYTHPALVAQYRGNQGGTFDHNYNWFDPANVCPSSEPCDNNNHGTHTMGTMVGDDPVGDNRIGVAPGAKWIAAKGCEQSTCSRSSLMAAGEWILAPTDSNGLNPRPDLRPNIVNNSWGGGGGDAWYQATVQAWVAAGIFPSFSNGNSGSSCGTAGSPGDYDDSYSAGAYASNGTIASFSSRGPGLAGVIKPNIAAPGVNVRSSVPGGGYASYQGTSMAAPHVSGVVALMWSVAPTLIGDIALTESLLNQTAVDTSDTSCGGTAENNNVWGEGKIDGFAAVDLSPRGPTGTLAGLITDGAGPIANANVTADGPSNRTAVTDASGNFSMTVPVGDYDVTASAYGYFPASVTGQTVTEGATTTVNLQLDAAPSFALSGTVTAAGQPVVGADVTLTGTPLSTVTDASGQYSFPAVLAGDYSLVIGSSGRCIAGETRAVSIFADMVEDFSLPERRDSFGYGCQIVAMSYVDATTQIALSGDDQSTSVALPFSFPFYGGNYSTAYISTNGHINFAGLNSTYSNTSLPNSSVPNLVIYPYWDDLYVDSAAGVWSETLGTAPNRTFVIEYRNVRFFSGTGNVDFEVLLGEDGTIRFQYKALDSSREQGNSATVGLENAAGNVAFQYSYNEAALASDLAIEFSVGNDDTVPPTVALTAPTEGEVLSGVVLVSADASDDVAVDRVEFYADLGTPEEALLGTASTSPYSIDWNTMPAVQGAHQLTARAFDTGGNSTDSAPVNVTLDNPVDTTPPVLSVTAPSEGELVSGTATIVADATDDVGVARVDISIDGGLVASLTAPPYEFDWDSSAAADGAHQIDVTAADLADNLTSVTVNVTSDNTGPTVALTAPAPGAILTGSVALSADASDSAGVVQVEFLIDGVIIETDTAAPYEASWDTTLDSDGSHEVAVFAYDALGNSEVASALVVSDNDAPTVAITAPVDGAVVRGVVAIDADANDSASGVEQVEFAVDGVALSTDTTAPYSASWDASSATVGAHVLTATARDLAGHVSTLASINVTVVEPFQFYWFEAEQGVLTAPLQVATDGNASEGQYIEATPGSNSTGSPPSNGQANYTFNVSVPGTFKLWGRTIAPSTSDDSFWVQVDGGTWNRWNFITASSSWVWDDVHQEDNGTITELFYDLGVGSHTITVAYREDGAQLDRLMITDDLSFVPTGAGPGSPPSPPSVLAAVAGEGQVTLNWAAVGSADSYTVKRGAAGGPYAELVSGLTDVTHTDLGLSNGVEYCYVVAAVNGNGMSGDSLESCATPCTGAACGPVFKLETVTTVANGTTQTVGLENSYDAPVVVCTPQYADVGVEVVPRVSQVGSSSFDLRLQVPGGGSAGDRDMYCLVVEQGDWNVDGVKLEAHTVNAAQTQSDSDWNAPAVSLSQSYTNPVIVGQVMTENDSNWSVFWASGNVSTDPPSAGGVHMGKHVGEDFNTSRAAETLGYIAIESGHGTLGGVPFEAGVGPDIVQGVTQSAPYQYDFATAFAQAPAFAVLSSAGMDGLNGGWPVLFGANPLGATSFGLAIDEDTIGDTERTHPTTQVAYLTFQDLIRLPEESCTGDADCDDGLVCNGSEICFEGACQAGTPLACDDGVSCTVDSCDEISGGCVSTADDSACDDGLFCNGVESCDLVADCVAGTAPDCDDGISCTVDTCDSVTDACSNAPDDAVCSDGAFCNGAEICDPAAGCIDAADPCPVGACDEDADICTAECFEDSDCDDAVFCNGAETCDAGSCLPGTAPDCDDGIGCTLDSCSAVSDSCVSAADDSACDDGLFCNGAETCNVASGCEAGTDPCDGAACDEAGDTCEAGCSGDSECDDGEYCNGQETCSGGDCQSGQDQGQACYDATPLARNQQSGPFNTTGERWFVVTDNPFGWQASEVQGRQIFVNGQLVSPGQMPLPPAINGERYFQFTAGSAPWASWSFW